METLEGGGADLAGGLPSTTGGGWVGFPLYCDKEHTRHPRNIGSSTLTVMLGVEADRREA